MSSTLNITNTSRMFSAMVRDCIEVISSMTLGSYCGVNEQNTDSFTQLGLATLQITIKGNRQAH